MVKMKNGFFERMTIKKLKSIQNKTKVELCINDIIEIYSPFSIVNDGDHIENNNAKINKEIIEYIKTGAENIPGKNGLIICIKISEKTNGKIETIEKLIKEHIQKKLLEINEKIRRTNRNAFIFAIIGIFLIAITQFYQIIERRYALNEFIIVMSWVFMWKAVEIIFFERIKLIKEKVILLKICYSEIRREQDK
jgi:hypothetical protein